MRKGLKRAKSRQAVGIASVRRRIAGAVLDSVLSTVPPEVRRVILSCRGNPNITDHVAKLCASLLAADDVLATPRASGKGGR